MREPMMYMGYRVVSNPNLTEQQFIPVVKYWWDKVAEWNPCNVEFHKPEFTVKHIPDRKVLVIEAQGVIMCHPAVVQEILNTK